MNLFWQLTKLSFRLQFSYRTATLAGLATNLFFGLLRAAVLIALYGARSQVAGISLAGAITYTGVSQASISFLSLFSWFDLMRSVYSGEVGADLLKPMNYFQYWMAQDLGRALFNLLLRGAPIMLFYALVFGITIPHGALQWLGLGASLLLAWMLSFSYRFLINLAAFWTPEATSIGRLGYSLAWFTSGFLMPLRFFPDWFVRLCLLTPFPQMINTPVEIYLNLTSGKALALALLWQASWVIVLIAGGQLVLRAGVRRLEILGG